MVGVSISQLELVHHGNSRVCDRLTERRQKRERGGEKKSASTPFSVTEVSLFFLLICFFYLTLLTASVSSAAGTSMNGHFKGLFFSTKLFSLIENWSSL